MIGRATVCALALVLAVVGVARADGVGQIIAPTQPLGPYRVTVFGGALPYATGPGSLAVLVQDAAGAPVLDQPIRLEATAPSGATALAHASFALSANRLLAIALVRFDEPGEWRIAVRVGELPDAARFTVPVREASALAWAPWIVAIAAPSLLVLAGRLLRRRKASSARRASKPFPGAR
ncbi:MAG: hypothetical protein NZ518_09370 [Dehalococcoidia bacterium]|nr:hypothetical protein [Dehalococcoidia bacterium]